MDNAPNIQMLCAALCLLTSFGFALGVDTLSPEQSLADGDILTSPGQIYVLGFFSPGLSKNRFLGIWYKATPDIVVWVANRVTPITDSKGLLTLTRNGTVFLRTAQSKTVWSSNSSSPVSDPRIQLLDTGNLVLLGQSRTIWQSFDYPSDTRLPGMQMVQNPDHNELDKYLTSWESADDPAPGEFSYRIENHGLPQMVVLMEAKKRFRTGPWNGIDFSDLPRFHVPAYNSEMVFNNGRLISILDSYSKSPMTRLTMNYSGFLQRYIMNEQRDAWSLVFALPGDSCDNYGTCGPNGACKIDQTPFCECLTGFEPNSQEEWRAFNWTSGCTRAAPLDCQKEDGFLKVERIKFPDPLINESSGCLMWFGDLIDIRDYPRDVLNSPSIYLRLPLFRIATIAAATNNFSSENLIGEGGFGPIMSSVLLMLSSDNAVLPQPKKPGLFLEENSNATQSSMATASEDPSFCEITITFGESGGRLPPIAQCPGAGEAGSYATQRK